MIYIDKEGRKEEESEGRKEGKGEGKISPISGMSSNKYRRKDRISLDIHHSAIIKIIIQVRNISGC